jgi:hypothetical protein
LWIETDTEDIYCYTGTTWVLISGIGTTVPDHDHDGDAGDGGRILLLSDDATKAPSVEVTAGGDIYLRLGDNAGANKVYIVNSDGATGADIDSDWYAQFGGGLNIKGATAGFQVDEFGNVVLRGNIGARLYIDISGNEDFIFEADKFRLKPSSVMELDGAGCKVDLNGVDGALVFDADGDTTISAPTDDEIDIEVGGSDIAEWKAGGLYGASGMDVYPEGDGGGLFQRNVDHWVVPNDHFNAFSGWTWATNGVFDGAPSSVDIASFLSLVTLVNDNIAEDHFAYKSGEATSIFCRLSKGINSYVGIRLDDGDDSDYIELRLVDSATVGFFRIDFVTNTGGAGPVTTTAVDNLSAAFYVIRLARSTGANWAVFSFYVKDTPIPLSTGAALGSLNWTPTRYGFIFGQRLVASSADRAGLIDWISYTTV